MSNTSCTQRITQRRGRRYSPDMVSPARRRRAWILLLLTWAIIAGVFGARYLSARRDEAARFDREAREQEALRQMDKMAAELATEPATTEDPSTPGDTPAPAHSSPETPDPAQPPPIGG